MAKNMKKGYINLTQKQYNKRTKLWEIIIWLILLLVSFGIIYTIDWSFVKDKPQMIDSNKLYLSAKDCLQEDDLPLFLIVGNSVRNISDNYRIETVALVDMLNENPDEMYQKIVFCESGGNPAAKNPSSTAKGLCQFIDSTWAYVQKKWDMELDITKEADQEYACKRLLEEEGLVHWKASQQCWENL